MTIVTSSCSILYLDVKQSSIDDFISDITLSRIKFVNFSLNSLLCVRLIINFLLSSDTVQYVFKTLLNVKIKSNTIVYLLLADSLFKALCSIFIPAPYYRIINMFFTVVLFRLFTRTEYRKMPY